MLSLCLWIICIDMICQEGGTHPKRVFRKYSRSQDHQLRDKSVHKTLIWKKNVWFCIQDQIFSENLVMFSFRSSKLATIFIQKLEKFVSISLQAPVFCLKSAHKTPLSWQFICTQAPISEIRGAHAYPKKIWVPQVFSKFEYNGINHYRDHGDGTKNNFSPIYHS